MKRQSGLWHLKETPTIFTTLWLPCFFPWLWYAGGTRQRRNVAGWNGQLALWLAWSCSLRWRCQRVGPCATSSRTAVFALHYNKAGGYVQWWATVSGLPYGQELAIIRGITHWTWCSASCFKKKKVIPAEPIPACICSLLPPGSIVAPASAGPTVESSDKTSFDPSTFDPIEFTSHIDEKDVTRYVRKVDRLDIPNLSSGRSDCWQKSRLGECSGRICRFLTSIYVLSH